MLRNRRTIIFTLIFPAALFFAFGGQAAAGRTRPARGNVAAYIMVSMALYGAALTAAAGGAMVALERALGWSRQLRLTPLNPVVYIVMKALVALVMGALAIAAVNVVGDRSRARPRCRTDVWIACAAGDAGLHPDLRGARRLRRLPRPGRERHADPRPRPGAAVLPGRRVHPARPVQPRSCAHRRTGRRCTASPRSPASPLTHELPWYAVVNAVGWFAGLRRRRRLADEQGHGAGVTAGTSVSAMSSRRPRRTAARATSTVAPAAGGCCSPRSGCCS